MSAWGIDQIVDLLEGMCGGGLSYIRCINTVASSARVFKRAGVFRHAVPTL